MNGYPNSLLDDPSQVDELHPHLPDVRYGISIDILHPRPIPAVLMKGNLQSILDSIRKAMHAQFYFYLSVYLYEMRNEIYDQQ